MSTATAFKPTTAEEKKVALQKQLVLQAMVTIIMEKHPEDYQRRMTYTVAVMKQLQKQYPTVTQIQVEQIIQLLLGDGLMNYADYTYNNTKYRYYRPSKKFWEQLKKSQEAQQ